MNTKIPMKRGQTVVILLVFMVIGITITSASVMILLSESSNTSKFQQALISQQIAESGAENALLRLLRDPTYTGETLTVGAGTATISVSGSTITSVGTSGNFRRTIQVQTTYTNNILTISSWQEIF